MELNKGCLSVPRMISPFPTTVPKESSAAAHCLSPPSNQCLGDWAFPESSSDRICKTIQLGI